LKKRSKKLLFTWATGFENGTGPIESKVFCALFFKKALLSCSFRSPDDRLGKLISLDAAFFEPLSEAELAAWE
jgi:hypothetical protein